MDVDYLSTDTEAGEPQAALLDDSEHIADGADDEAETLFSTSRSSLQDEIDDDDTAATLIDEVQSSDDIDEDGDDEYDEDEDESNDGDDESDAETAVSDYPHIGKQRQSSRMNQVLYFKATHQLTLTKDGIKQVKSTESGREALRKQQSEGAKVQLRRRDVPLTYTSPNVVQPLLEGSEDRFYPIVAREDQIYLELDTTILFPSKEDHRKPSPAEIRRSGLNTAIRSFFEQNRDALGIREVTVLDTDDDHKDFYTIRLDLKSKQHCWGRSAKQPLAILESIRVKLRCTKKGERKLAKQAQWQSRESLCQAVLSPSPLPLELLLPLERGLSRFAQDDLLTKYGALFNEAYCERASKVEKQIMSIATMMAKMYVVNDELQTAIEEAAEAGITESEERANRSGRHGKVLAAAEVEVKRIHEKTEEIQKELIELDKREYPTACFKPQLVLSSKAKKEKEGASGSSLVAVDIDPPASSQTSQFPQCSQASQSSQPIFSSQASTLVSSSPPPPPMRKMSTKGRKRASPRAATLQGLPPSDVDEVPRRSSHRLRSHTVDTSDAPRPSQSRLRGAISVRPSSYEEPPDPTTEDEHEAEEASQRERTMVPPTDAWDVLETLKEPCTNASDEFAWRKCVELAVDTVPKEPDDGGTINVDEEIRTSWEGIVEIIKNIGDSKFGQEQERENVYDLGVCFGLLKSILEDVPYKKGKEVDALRDVEEDEESSGRFAQHMMTEVDGQEAMTAEANRPSPRIRRGETDHQQGRPRKKARLSSTSSRREEQSSRASQVRDGENVQVNGGMAEEGQNDGGTVFADSAYRPAMIEASPSAFSHEASHTRLSMAGEGQIERDGRASSSSTERSQPQGCRQINRAHPNRPSPDVYEIEDSDEDFDMVTDPPLRCRSLTPVPNVDRAECSDDEEANDSRAATFRSFPYRRQSSEPPESQAPISTSDNQSSPGYSWGDYEFIDGSQHNPIIVIDDDDDDDD